MMNKYFVALLVLINWELTAQNVFWSENFDEVMQPSLPIGWSASGVEGSIGWRLDSTNSSGYVGASDGNNVVIRNNENGSGEYTLLSPIISAVGQSDLSVKFGSRVSSNFLISGSELPLFYFSIDGGLSWSALTFEDNDANSVWGWVNLDQPLLLPSIANNQPLLRFKWVIHIVGDGLTTSGTYRIDDFNLMSGNIASQKEWSQSTNFVIENNGIRSLKEELEDVHLFNALGQKLKLIKQSSFYWSWENLPTGVYFLQMPQESNYMPLKFWKQ